MERAKTIIVAIWSIIMSALGILAIPVMLLITCNIIDYATGLVASKFRNQDHPGQKSVDPGVLHQAVQRRCNEQNDDKRGQHHPHRCRKGACQPRLRSTDKGGHVHCQRAGRRL